MRLADDPTPADPLRPLIADMDEEAAALVRRVLRLATVHEHAAARDAAHPPIPLTPESSCP